VGASNVAAAKAAYAAASVQLGRPAPNGSAPRPDDVEPPPATSAAFLDYCKGCGICAAECPCGAIDMVPERV
jgi:ferredoxin